MHIRPKKPFGRIVLVVAINLIIFFVAYNFSEADMLEAIFITYFSFAAILAINLFSYIRFIIQKRDVHPAIKLFISAVIAVMLLPWFLFIALPVLEPLTGTEQAIENLSWIFVLTGVVVQLNDTSLRSNAREGSHGIINKVIASFVNIGIIFLVLTSFSTSLSSQDIAWLVVAVQLLYISNYIATETNYLKFINTLSSAINANAHGVRSGSLGAPITIIGYGLMFLPSILIILSVV